MKVGGAVAAGHQLTAEAATEVLIDGGNAFDAIVAGLLVASVVEPVLCSLGGGGFLMARPAGRRVDLVDFFADAPLNKRNPDEVEFVDVSADFGTATQSFKIGKGSIATPGMIPGLFFIQEHLGSLPMRRLIEPAVAIAKNGHRVTKYQAELAAIVKPILTFSAEARKQFSPSGDLIKQGDIYKNPALGETFEALAEDGVRFAVDGPLGQAILDGQDSEGFLTVEDLRRYEVRHRPPLKTSFAGAMLALNPAPSMGGALISNMLARMQHDTIDPLRIAEAMELTDRQWHLDPQDYEGLCAAALPRETLINKTVQRGTTHISVIDSEGNAASTTVSNGEGNGEILPEFGFMPNNMLGEEDVNPKGFHSWVPGHRLSSMMVPTLVRKDDGTIIALGSGGSNRIRTAIFQVLLRLLAEGSHVTDAVCAPRLHVEKAFLDYENGYNEGEVAKLVDAFPEHHRYWEKPSMYFGGVHAVSRNEKGGFDGAGDTRRAGVYLTA
ncbi:MAG: gamma-glutamyltransferase [Stappiaceae bacterium]